MSVAIDAIEGPPGAAARWSSIDWPAVRRHVSRLQARIVKAIKAGKLATWFPGASRRLTKA
jgi:RNA-directed DNA polymerase